MRLSLVNPAVKVVRPGSTVSWTFEVVNDGSVIEGVALGLDAVDPADITVSPLELPLFPAETGRIDVSFRVPLTFPSGRHVLSFAARSRVSYGLVTAVAFIDVEPRVGARVGVHPPAVRTRRRAAYSLTYSNTGNLPIAVVLSASDADRTMRYDFDAATFAVAPGETVHRQLTVRAKRVLFGSDTGRPFEVLADGGGLELTAQGELRQRPILARGLSTVAVLLCIIALWATAFLVGLHAAFTSDALTKTAPASFFLTDAQRQGLAAATTVDGVVPKSGPLDPGVGGTISGAVRAFGTGQPVGRIVVSAWRRAPSGLRLVSSAASQSDGTYDVVNLFPGSYDLEFRATGFRDVWFPSSHASSGAVEVGVDAGAVTKGIDVAIKGLPGSMTGTVDPGDTLAKVPVTVTARSLLSSGGGKPVTVTAKANSNGTYSYTLPNLPTPDNYQLSVSAAGYAASLTSDFVDGGQDRSEPTIRLSAADSSISGTVTAGGRPVGGVTVSTSLNGTVLSTGTPTTGNGIGSFTLANLPTPGTYVLTFTAAGYSADPLPETLEPGAIPRHVSVTLQKNTNSVSGHVSDTAGDGLGNVTVSVGGTATALTTTTLTAAAPGSPVGSFTLAGLPSTGSFTLTFSAAGYAPQTAPLVLDGKDPKPLEVTLKPATGTVYGQVLTGSAGTTPSVGATVTVTDGVTPHTTTTTDNPADPPAAGQWSVAGLAPGTYTITATNTGFGQRTAVVTVTAGVSTRVTLDLPPAGS